MELSFPLGIAGFVPIEAKFVGVIFWSGIIIFIDLAWAQNGWILAEVRENGKKGKKKNNNNKKNKTRPWPPISSHLNVTLGPDRSEPSDLLAV